MCYTKKINKEQIQNLYSNIKFDEVCSLIQNDVDLKAKHERRRSLGATSLTSKATQKYRERRMMFIDHDSESYHSTRDERPLSSLSNRFDLKSNLSTKKSANNTSKNVSYSRPGSALSTNSSVYERLYSKRKSKLK